MNTPARRALGDVRNQLAGGTPGREGLVKPTGSFESLKTPATMSRDLVQRPSTATKIQPRFLSFDGDDFEVYSEEVNEF